MALQAKKLANRKPLDDAEEDAAPVDVMSAVVTTSVNGTDEGQTIDAGEDSDGSAASAQCVRDHAAPVEILALKTTNSADDYAHRGPELRNFHFLGYQMFVRRVPLGHTSRIVYPFEPHYALAGRFGQELRVKMAIPRLCNFRCPSVFEDSEANALSKGLLFRPVNCPGPGFCNHVQRFFPLLGLSPQGHETPLPGGTVSFEAAWKVENARIQRLASKADELENAARRILVLQDTTLQKVWTTAEPEQHSFQAQERRLFLKELTLAFRLPERTAQHVAAFLCVFDAQPDHICEFGPKSRCKQLHWGHHDEQCTVEEFMSQLARQVCFNLDLAAESKHLPKSRPQQSAEDDVPDDVDGKRLEAVDLQITDVGGAGEGDFEDDAGDLEYDTQCVHGFECTSEVVDLVLRKHELQEAEKAKKCTREQMCYKRYAEAYGDLLFRATPLKQANTSRQSFVSRHVGKRLGPQKALGMLQQKAFIARYKAQAEAAGAGDEDYKKSSVGSAQVSDSDCALVPLPLREQGPAAAAWQLAASASLNEEQTDAVALVARQLHRMWLQHAAQGAGKECMPSSWSSENLRVFFLGGGGCGKTYTILHVVKPLIELFFGKDGFEGQCPSNAGARLFQARTVHASIGLTATASLAVENLKLEGKTRTKVEKIAVPAAALAIDECSQLSGSLLHANAIRHTYARKRACGLKLEDCLSPNESFGRLPIVILSGDYLQLPPVPEKTSVLWPTAGATYEQRQGRALVESFPYVFEFRQSNRFKDKDLIHILDCMRTPGGKIIHDDAWKSLEDRLIQSSKNNVDPRLQAASDWLEAAYDWRTISLAQHVRMRLAAAAAGQVLFYIPAIDKPCFDCPKPIFRSMTRVPSMTTTKKLMGVLPVYVGAKMRLTKTLLAPELVPERECTVIGIELHPQDEAALCDSSGCPAASVLQDGCFVLQHMPECILVQFEDLALDLIEPVPCEEHCVLGATRHCPACQFFTGIVALQPESVSWTYSEVVKPPSNRPGFKPPPIRVDARRTQIPLAPALPKTLHCLQGITARPGLVAHFALPPVSTATRWLSYYVLLSRVECLSQLLCHKLPDRGILEGGPPEALQEALNVLFSQKVDKTHRAAKDARKELGWPCSGAASSSEPTCKH